MYGKCTNCKHELKALFQSLYCENCEKMKSSVNIGYIVWRQTDKILNYVVFPSYTDAKKWKTVNDIKDGKIKAVNCCSPLNFKKSSGILKDIKIADTLYEIYPNKKFEPRPHRGYIMQSKPEPIPLP